MRNVQVLDDGPKPAEENEQDQLPTHQTPLSRFEIISTSLQKVQVKVKLRLSKNKDYNEYKPVKVKEKARPTTNTSNAFAEVIFYLKKVKVQKTTNISNVFVDVISI